MLSAQVFPISPRNSPTAICHLLRTVSSHRLVTESSLQSLVKDIKEEFASLFPHIYPHLGRESNSDTFEPVPPFPNTGSPDEVALYFHSSGSTGFPKAIPMRNELFHKLVHSFLVESVKDLTEHYCESPGCSVFLDPYP
jgi:acyl-CoA synthetase (AMP-forming)/AMP-acid ligase II